MTANKNKPSVFIRQHTCVSLIAATGLWLTSMAYGQDRGSSPLPDDPLHPDVLLAILTAWGACDGPCPADLNGDGMVNSADVALAVSKEAYVPVHQLVPRLASGPDLRTCRVEPMPGVVISRAKSALGGGMAGDGWDGGGQHATIIYWYVENTTGDIGAGQRQALIDAMQAWANVVQITFQEVCKPNHVIAVDWAFYTGDHSAFEPQEAGDSDCPFDGPFGILAHAGFPPGVLQNCGGGSAETKAGNVHFDDAELWEQDSEGGANTFSLTEIACHEVGHGIGLTHDNSGGDDVMAPSISSADTFNGLSADDIANVQSGYAAGTGAVITLNESGIWVNGAWAGVEHGNDSASPVNTIIEGLNGIPPFTSNHVIHIEAGSYSETMFISSALELRAENGSVIIGD